MLLKSASIQIPRTLNNFATFQKTAQKAMASVLILAVALCLVPSELVLVVNGQRTTPASGVQQAINSRSDAPGACPPKCTCFRSTVRCLFQQLTSIPQIPAGTTVLDLRFNNIGDIAPGTFQGLSTLHTILLNNNQLVRLRNGSFDGLTNLRFLYLYKNQISAIEVDAFRHMTNLEQLYLHHNDLENVEPGTFRNLTSLERLFLHNNRLQRVHKDTLSNLRRLARLQLDANALICDCELMWLSDMLRDGHVQAAVTCEQPQSVSGKSFMDVARDIACRKPELTTRPRDVEVSFGNTAYLTCSADGEPRPEIVWYRDNEQIKTNQTDDNHVVDNGIDGDGRYSVLPDGTLMIENARDVDEGVYECVARNQLGETKAKPVELRYVDSIQPVRPRIISGPTDLSLSEGESATFECRSSGQPRPSVVWLRNDIPLSPADRRVHIDLAESDTSTSTLTLADVQSSDRGVYRCVVSNEQGSASDFARLEVFVAPQFVKRPQDQRIAEGHPVFFTCDATSEPLPKFHWNKDGNALDTASQPGGRVTINPSGTTLTISVVESSDAGVYECVVESPGGRRTASARLIVSAQAPPVIRRGPRDIETSAGSSATFECLVSGDPQPTVRWLRDENVPVTTSAKYDVTHDGSVLVIRDVGRSDDGVYECVVENTAGIVRSVGRLIVWDTRYPSLSSRRINDTVSDATRRVNFAVDSTRRALSSDEPTSADGSGGGPASRRRTADDLMRLVRYPPSQAFGLARSAEIFEQTLEALLAEVNAGYQYSLNTTKAVTYDELLSPAQLALVSSLSGCQEHRRVAKCDDMCYHMKYRTMDGTCNNLRHPMFGASLTPVLRLRPARYENNFNLPVGWDVDKLYNGVPLPSARTVSLGLVSTGRVTSDEQYSHMLMQWGQFIDHDIDFVPTAVAHARFSDGRYCNETCQSSGPCFAIPVPADDPRVRRHPRRGRCIGFVRSSAMCGSGSTSVFFNNVMQRQQLNALTSFIDASMIYGSSEDDARNLRDFTTSRGLLRTSPPPLPSQKPLLPPNQGEPIDCQMDATTSHVPCFQAGDHRVNEQLGLLTMHTLWMREHNRLAGEISTVNPHWDSDTIYHETRKLVGAIIQHITYQHWLPKVLGETGMRLIGPYKGYDPYLEPGTANEFATAAFRFGHTLIQPIIARFNESFKPIPAGNLLLHRAFFAPFRLVDEGGVDPIIRGLFGLQAKMPKSGQFMNSELTERLFALAHEVANDLAAFNIQRGRDHGLQSYNEYRKHCGLVTSSSSFDDFRNEIRNEEVRLKLKQLYGHPDNVDLFVGGIAEDPIEGARVGPTFMCIIADQFRRLRDGDRFWYENPGVFTPAQLNEIRHASLQRIICDNADNIHVIPPDVFVFQHNLPDGQLSCDVIPRIDVKVWAQCCQECSRSGDFRSITHHFRQRRSVNNEQSRKDERPLADQTSVESVSGRSSIDSMLEEAMHMSQKMMDVVDARIEGMEDVMKSLQETIQTLSGKLKKMEKMMPSVVANAKPKSNVTATTKRPASNVRPTWQPCLDDQGRVKVHGSRWIEHDCRHCTCKNGQLECTTETCPLPQCSTPVKEPGRCCPVCPS